MKKNKITIIVAIFNAKSTIQRCLDSIIDQDYPDKELIVIDGGSSDGTIDILEQYQDHFQYWESKPDSGIYHAWNKALPHMTGEWVLFLGSDDFFWKSDVLSKAAKSLEPAYPQYRVIYGQIACVDKSEKILEYAGVPWEQAGKRFLVEMTIPHTATFHHYTLFQEYGVFDQRYRIAGDYEFLLRALRKESPYFLEDLVVVGMQQGGISSTPSTSIKALNEFRAARVQNGLVGKNSAWIWCYMKALGKFWLSRSVGDKWSRNVIDFYRRMTGRRAIWGS